PPLPAGRGRAGAGRRRARLAGGADRRSGRAPLANRLAEKLPDPGAAQGRALLDQVEPGVEPPSIPSTPRSDWFSAADLALTRPGARPIRLSARGGRARLQ